VCGQPNDRWRSRQAERLIHDKMATQTGGGVDNGATSRGLGYDPGPQHHDQRGGLVASRLRRPQQRVRDARSMAHGALILPAAGGRSPVGSSAQNPEARDRSLFAAAVHSERVSGIMPL
jgi:hypothetical protein